MAGGAEGNGGAGLRNVLVLSPTPSHRTTQGNRRRILRVCEGLQRRGCRIHFVYFPREWNAAFNHAEYAAITAVWDSFHVVAHNSLPPHHTDAPYWGIDDWWDEAIGRYLAWLCSIVPMDMAIVNYAFFSKAFDHLPAGTLKVLDTHDRLSDRRELLEANAVAPEFFYTTKAEEAKALDRADLVLAIKDEERRFFETITRRPVLTLGHFEPPPEGVPVTKGRIGAEPLRFGLLGSNNSINRENFTRFLDTALPLFRGAGARLRLLIGGTISHSFAVRGGMEDYVEVVGPVDDVADFYRRIDVSLNPFDFSTGLKIKVAEALAHGVAVIGTRNAFEGIVTDLPAHRIDSLDDLARLCLALADEPARVADLRSACQAVYRGLGETVDAVLDRLVALTPPQILAVADLPDDRVPSPRVEAWLRLLESCGHTTLLLAGADAPNLRAWLAGHAPRVTLTAAGHPAALAGRVHAEATRRRAALVVLLTDIVGIPQADAPWRAGPWTLLVDVPDGRDPTLPAGALGGGWPGRAPLLVTVADPRAAQTGPAVLPDARFVALPDPLPAIAPPPPAALRTVHVLGVGNRHRALFERLAALLSGGRWSAVRTVLVDADRQDRVPELLTPTRRIAIANPAAAAAGWVRPPDLLIDLGDGQERGTLLDGLRARALRIATPTLVLGAGRHRTLSAGALGLLTAPQLLAVVEALRRCPERLAGLARDRREAALRLGIDDAWQAMAKTVAGILSAADPFRGASASPATAMPATVPAVAEAEG
ncbi:glycosyltransferase involved in cell wall biosynthesis [Azospirillum brasilense]|nr:glycosyltransferase involved in cell wall biosynthesis [Azospirillum brasilense]